MPKYLTITIFSALAILLVLPQVVSAAVLPFDFGQDSLVPCGRQGKSDCNLCHFFELIQNIINLFVSLIILIAPVILMFGGFMILSSAGIPERVSYGKRVLTYAVIALLITFGGWMIINTVLVTVAGNIEVDGQKVGKIHGFTYPWNKIKCYAEPVSNGGNGAEGEYCVCETLVYDLDPGAYPAQAKPIATNVETHKLSDTAQCQQRCNSSYINDYCPQVQSGVQITEYNFRCKTEAAIKNTAGVGLKQPGFVSNSTCILGCFQTEEECVNCTNPDDPNFESCGRECFFEGVNYCDCVFNGGRCVGTEKKWALLRYRKEKKCDIGNPGSNLYDCVFTTDNETCVCRLSGTPVFGETCDDCSAVTTGPNWCQRSAPAGSGNWPYASSQMQANQKGDASIDLISFLNCFYNKPGMQNYPLVSISDSQVCNDNCAIKENACSTACQHSCESGHYGCGEASSCHGFSLAVDIDIEDGSIPQEAAINKAAAECLNELGWGGTIRCLGPSNDPTYHNNHIHIGIASALSDCKCDKLGSVDEACILDLLAADTHYECYSGFCTEVEGAGTSSCTLIGEYDPACTHRECIGYTCDEVPNTGQTDESDLCINNSNCAD